MNQKYRLARSLPCLAVLALAGCGPATGSISGKVTFKDKPLPGGTVTFLGSDKKVRSAPIGNDGTYTVEKVAVGEAKIGVAPPPPPPRLPGGMKMDPSKMGGGPEGAAPTSDDKPVIIPDKYQTPEKSGLTFTVNSGKQDHNIELK
jgi:hypothetical protein